MKQIIRRVAALVIGLGLGAVALAGLETVTHISDLNASWPLGSDLASTSDDHIRNIKTALKTDFPNINAAINATPTELNQLTSNTFTTAVTGNSFIPASTTVPPNGLYLPSTNTIGWSTNTTARGSVNSTGNWTINAPSSGYSLLIGSGPDFYENSLLPTSISGVIAFVSSSGSPVGGRLIIGDGSGWHFKVAKRSGGVTTDLVDFADSGNSLISGYGPTAAALVDMTPDTGTFTSTYTGFTANPTCTSTWSRVGKLAILTLCAATATSNSTSFAMTGLPSAIQPATLSQRVPIATSAPEDGGVQPVNAQFDVTITAASGTLNFNKGGAGTGWTSSSTKGIFNATTLSYLLN